MTEREFIENIASSIEEALGDAEHYEIKGPFTTLYWDNTKKDNVPQQTMSVTLYGKTFDVIVRERK